MTIEEVIAYVECVMGAGCIAPCNERRVGGCSDGDVFEASDIAINALKKQMPKKPKDDGWLYCPCCGVYLDCVGKPLYCDKCGQAIDWGEEEMGEQTNV